MGSMMSGLMAKFHPILSLQHLQHPNNALFFAQIPSKLPIDLTWFNSHNGRQIAWFQFVPPKNGSPLPFSPGNTHFQPSNHPTGWLSPAPWNHRSESAPSRRHVAAAADPWRADAVGWQGDHRDASWGLLGYGNFTLQIRKTPPEGK